MYIRVVALRPVINARWVCFLLQVKETATRMLTNFSVQAGTNDFYTAQRLFRDASIKVLPQVRAGQHLMGHRQKGTASKLPGDVCVAPFGHQGSHLNFVGTLTW
jgi:hypothetical protein